MTKNTFQIIALHANQLQREFSHGFLTFEEYREFLENIGAANAVLEDVANIEDNFIYREMLNNAINITKTPV